MKTPSHAARTLGSVLTTGGGVLVLSSLAGCWGSGGDKATQTLTPAEFHAAAADAPPKQEAKAPDAAAPANEASPASRSTAAAVPAGPSVPQPVPAVSAPGVAARPRVVAVAGDAPRADGTSKPVGRDVLADCMVGQINGRPVFASEILDPLDGQLAASAKDVKGAASAQAWVRATARLIREKIELRVRDELLLGEARARLSPEAKQGLIYFLQRVDQWASGQSGGSRAQAEEAIAARTGESYDKFLQSQRDQTLIRDLIKENVSPYVRVPWRKIERFYAENQTALNPPPYAVVRILMLEAPDAETLARAQSAATAAEGTAFRDLAVSPANRYAGKDIRTGADIKGGLVARVLDKPYDQIEWVGNKSWNQAASKLAPDQGVGPIDTGDFKVFIRREADYVTPHRSLEDMQLMISSRLTATKEAQEQNEFFIQLLGKGSFTPVGRMTLELLVLAAQRHLPPDLAGAVRDANPLGVDSGPALERSPTPQLIDDLSLDPSKASTKPAPAPATPAAPPK